MDVHGESVGVDLDVLDQLAEQDALLAVGGVGPQVGDVQLFEHGEHVFEPGGEVDALDGGARGGLCVSAVVLDLLADAGLLSGEQGLVDVVLVEELQQHVLLGP